MGKLFNRLMIAVVNIILNLFNLRIKLKYVLLALIVFTGSAVGITYSKLINQVGGKSDYDEAMRYIEMKDVLDDNFIDDVDRSSLANSASAAMVNGLGDKWSYYMTADEYKTYQLYSSNEYADIGMSIIKDENSGGFQVVSVSLGAPAANAGLTAGMVITSVDGIDVTGLDSDDVRTLIRSRLNTKFTIGVLGSKELLNVDCSYTYVSPVFSRLEKTEAGYVKIDNFEAGSGQDAVDAIESLLDQGATALVIDLRGNAGGLASEATVLLDYLLPNCDLFCTVGKDGKKDMVKSDSVCLNLPTVVLVNTGTYSEAEVFAAVMQEQGWATIMGETTQGKTRTQQTIELSDGSAVRLSTRRYLTAKGTDISRTGVVPDSIVYNSDASTVGTTDGTTGITDGSASTSSDEQLMAALRLLS